MFFLNLLIFTTISVISSSKRPQSFENGQYSILQLTDMHYAEDETLDKLSIWFTEDLLEYVKPSLTVFSGDLVTGEMLEYNPFPNFYEFYWKQLTKPFEDFNSTYAIILGNHDSTADLSRREIMQLDMTHPNSISEVTPQDLPGASNYFIDVYSSILPGKVAARIWMFDSGATGCNGHGFGYGCVEMQVVDWYTEESKKFKLVHGEEPVHIAFVHIPLPEYVELADSYPIAGKKEEDVQCPIFNSGLFETAVANGDIKAFFSGHDHLNDFQGALNGVELVYGRKSGYGGNGPSGDIESKRGGRVIKFEERLNDDGSLNVTYHHYVVNEDGQEELKNPALNFSGQKQYYCGNGLIFARRYGWLIVLGIVILVVTIKFRKNNKNRRRFENIQDNAFYSNSCSSESLTRNITEHKDMK